jgi:branched-chain amino acid transport system substrate-binding protein
MAATAIQQGNFAAAIPKLEALRQKYRNDPEILIYLNNARIGTAPAVTVAVVSPMSDTPDAAQEILRGVAQLQDEYNNANNDSSLPIRLVVADDGNDPERAKAIAQTLVADTNIAMVIGHGTSTTSLAAAPIYEQNQLVAIAPTSTSTELSQIGPSNQNFVYRTIPSDQITGTALARYALKNFKLFAIVYNSESSYSSSLKTAFATTLSLEGGQVVEEIDLAQENSLSGLSNLSAEAIALLPDSKTLDRAIAIARANANRFPIIAGDAMYRIETLQQAGRELQGTVLPVAWDRNDSADPSFPGRAETLWGGDVNWRTALSFDAARVLEALVQTGATNRVDIASRLAAGDVVAIGVTGAINFLPSGDRDGKVVLVKIEPGTRSKTGYDFVPIE